MVGPDFRLKTTSLEAAKVKLKLDLALLQQSASRAKARLQYKRETHSLKKGILGLRNLIREYILKR